MSTPIATRASAKQPCEVCGQGTKGCSVTTDGMHICRGEPRDGWKCLTRFPDGAGFHHYRRHDDNGHARNGHTPAPTKPVQDWPAIVKGYCEALTPENRKALAAQLGLPVGALDVLPIGWRTNDKHGACWTFPMSNAAGEVVGIARRYTKPVVMSEGAKPTNKASFGHAGLTLPDGWRERPGPLFVVEGASDVLALSLCGLAVIGRPSNTGGVAMLRELLAPCPDRAVYVVGENDCRENGDWPGRDGAESVAKQLAEALNRSIWWTMPPNGIKDIREWATEIASGFGECDDWPGAGREMANHLVSEAKAILPPKGLNGVMDPVAGRIEVETLAALRPKAVRYLVPDRFPAGMMGLITGDGGHGKSLTTLHLAAAITTGRCAFGLNYPDPVRGKVLLVSAEDDWERTIVPRLAAFGADMNRVLRIKGVRMKPGGEVLDFHLGHFRELDRLLSETPDIKLVTVDPAGAFIGRSGVNENKDAELRTILGPLSESSNRSGATVALVKHLNKTANVSAVQRVSGSTGYVNAVRFAYMTVPDPEDPERKLMLPIKANVLKSGLSGLAYRLVSMPEDEAREILLTRWPDLDPSELEPLTKQMLIQEWEGETDMTADAACSRRIGTRGGTPAQCEAFIREYLGDHSHPEKELEAAATKAGFSFKTFKDTKTAMRKADKLDSTRLSGKPRGEGGPWWVWIGPQPEPKPDRPALTETEGRESKR